MSRLAVRPRTSHVDAAARMREVPGVWLPVGCYRSSQTATSIAGQIRTGYRLPVYLPAGSFEARTEPVGDEVGVTARYVGQRAVAISPFLLLWLVVRIGDLSDALAAARQTVGQQQAEFDAERATFPKRGRS